MEYKIKELREKRNLSQSELARISGVSRPTIVRLENDEQVVIKSKTLEKIANALNVSIKSLFLP